MEDDKNEKKRSLQFKRLSLDNIRKRISMDKLDPDYYSSVEVDEEYLVVNNSPVHTSTTSTSHQMYNTVTNSGGGALSPINVQMSGRRSDKRSTNSKSWKSPTHARSHSDGCWDIPRSTDTNTSNKTLYQTESSSFSRSADGTSFLNTSLLGENIVGVDCLYVDQKPTVDRNEQEDNNEVVSNGNSNSSFSSRFPRPKPGESLISFLSSADLYKNCGVLDRENAHFYISEALMAAFEQIRFEADCRAAGLLDDSGDESDEEIKQLQDRIRQKRQQKLGIVGQNSVPGPGSAVTAALPSASTTDYSLYESPLSSTHTESSDPFSDTDARYKGLMKKNRNVAGHTRTKRKTMKRSTPRCPKETEVMFRSSSGLSDTNDAEFAAEDLTGSGASCCTLSNLDLTARPLGAALDDETETLVDTESATDVASITSECHGAGTGSVVSQDFSDSGRRETNGKFSVGQGLNCDTLDQTCQQNHDNRCQNQPSIYHSTAPDQRTKTNRTLIGRDGTLIKSSTQDWTDSLTVKLSSLGSNGNVSMSCSPVLPHHEPDRRTAEGIGLQLLQHLSTPQDRLPKASELQWLVSERDVPQKLLPLPTPDCGADHVLLRGTPDWAPPREQLILSLQKERKRSTVLVGQQYRCAGCGQQVSPALSKHYRLCHYFVRYFCATCHMNQAHIIPAKVLHQWDVKQYPVSCFAHQLLTRLYCEPLFYPSAINSSLYSSSRSLNQFRLFRMQLYHCLPYVNTCARAARERLIVRDQCPSHWAGDGEVVSLQELVGVKASGGAVGGVLQTLHTLTGMVLEHVAKCQTCQGRGFICEVCHDSGAIFPFELATVRVCDLCSACTHYRCHQRECGRCRLRRDKGRRPPGAGGRRAGGGGDTACGTSVAGGGGDTAPGAGDNSIATGDAAAATTTASSTTAPGTSGNNTASTATATCTTALTADGRR